MTLTLDLSGSKAGLIFDTTATGAGVEVFQPLEIAAGAENIASMSTPTDGDTRLDIALNALAPNAETRITIDLDDTLAASDLGQIRVSGAEIEGAEVTTPTATAAFGADAIAVLKTTCDIS